MRLLEIKCGFSLKLRHWFYRNIFDLHPCLYLHDGFFRVSHFQSPQTQDFLVPLNECAKLKTKSLWIEICVPQQVSHNDLGPNYVDFSCLSHVYLRKIWIFCILYLIWTSILKKKYISSPRYLTVIIIVRRCNSFSVSTEIPDINRQIWITRIEIVNLNNIFKRYSLNIRPSCNKKESCC